MLNDPDVLMLFARERQEELRRAMLSARRSLFWQTLSMLRRPARGGAKPLRSARRGA